MKMFIAMHSLIVKFLIRDKMNENICFVYA